MKTSLTSFIKKREVSNKIFECYPLPSCNLNRKILAPPLSKNYPLVGTAFDYLLRFYIKRLNPDAIEKRWIAEFAASIISNSTLDKEIREELNKKVEKIIKDAKTEYANFLNSGKMTDEMTDELIANTIKLAKLDPIYRSNTLIYASPEQFAMDLDEIDKKDILDLRNLFALIPKDLFIAKKYVLLNPDFPEASSLVHGADCDLIIDGNIVEIKTTKELKLKKDYWAQLIGYVVLAEIANEVNVQFPKIKQFSIYFSRYAFMLNFDARDIYSNPKYPEFRKWFENEAKRLYS